MSGRAVVIEVKDIYCAVLAGYELALEYSLKEMTPRAIYSVGQPAP